MANRIPLIVNTTAAQIQEIPSGDVLNFDNKVVLTNTTTSISNNASIGALVVTGGIGIGGASNFGDVVTLSKSSGTSLAVSSNQASSSKTTGAVTVVGGVGISGALNVGGDITAFSSSDVCLKKNISPISNAIDKVRSISGNTFTWNEKSVYNGKEGTGIIAQEIEALELPGVTETREDGTKAVRYDRLVPLLIEAIKELDGKIKSLER